MIIPNRIEIAQRLCDMISGWNAESRVFQADVACEDFYDEYEERLYLRLTRPGAGSNYISFTIGEIYDIANLLTQFPEKVTLHCATVKDWGERYIEMVNIAVDMSIIREDLTTRKRD